MKDLNQGSWMQVIQMVRVYIEDMRQIYQISISGSLVKLNKKVSKQNDWYILYTQSDITRPEVSEVDPQK